MKTEIGARIEPEQATLRRPFLPWRSLILLAGILAILAWGAIQALSGSAAPGAPGRHLTIEARDVKFSGTNPSLELRVGEPVALTVVNGEQSIAHDFLITGLGVRTPSHLQPGESLTLSFTPERAGSYTYSCTLHPGLMDGQVIVRQQ